MMHMDFMQFIRCMDDDQLACSWVAHGLCATQTMMHMGFVQFRRWCVDRLAIGALYIIALALS